MLADSKASRFIDDFARQWLQLHRVGMFPPDKKLYPDLRRVAGDEHARRARRVFPRDVREEPAHRQLHRFRLDHGQRPALRFLRTAGAEDGRLPARLAQARGSSRRSADDGRGARADLGRHAPSPGASRRVGQRSDLRQDAAAAAGQRDPPSNPIRRKAPRPPSARRSKRTATTRTAPPAMRRSTRWASPGTTTMPSASGAPARRSQRESARTPWSIPPA